MWFKVTNPHISLIQTGVYPQPTHTSYSGLCIFLNPFPHMQNGASRGSLPRDGPGKMLRGMQAVSWPCSFFYRQGP